MGLWFLQEFYENRMELAGELDSAEWNPRKSVSASLTSSMGKFFQVTIHSKIGARES